MTAHRPRRIGRPLRPQAALYGQCIEGRMMEIKHGVCAPQFDALMACVRAHAHKVCLRITK